MKARAGFFTLLIALVSFAGFGFTTPDLSQNSEPTEVHQDAVVNVVAVIAVDQELQILKETIFVSIQDVVKPAALKNERLFVSESAVNLVNDVGKLRNYRDHYNLKYRAFHPKHYRSPRDGLNSSMT